MKVALRRNKGILEFLGFVDGKGRIRKGRVKKIRNPASTPVTVASAGTRAYANKLATYYRRNGYRVNIVKSGSRFEVRVYDTARTK